MPAPGAKAALAQMCCWIVPALGAKAVLAQMCCWKGLWAELVRGQKRVSRDVQMLCSCCLSASANGTCMKNDVELPC